MRRLTHIRVNGIKRGYWTASKKEELASRLAQYEDIGLTPNQIKALLDACVSPAQKKGVLERMKTYRPKDWEEDQRWEKGEAE